MRWLVEITDIQDEPVLRRVLDGAGYQIVSYPNAHNVERFLSSAALDAKDEASDVWRQAAELRQKLQRFNAYDSSLALGFKVGHVHEVKADGTLGLYHVLAPLSGLKLSLKATVIGRVSGNLEFHRDPAITAEERSRLKREAEEHRRQEREREIERAVKLATRAIEDPSVMLVMLLCAIEKPSGTQLGHILDLVRDACSGDLSAFASGNQITRFERSINHPAVFGPDARHAVSHVDAPPQPMPPDEAREFAHTLGAKWLEFIGH